jgi:peptidoglycan hydrolase-like protein with peptidoglycan-binding domain
MIGIEAFFCDRRVATTRFLRGFILVSAAAAIVAGSVGNAEARRGGKTVRDIGIGIGAAIILNEVLKSGEPKRRAGPGTPARVSLDAERIRALQTALSAHGYDAGGADGVWGNRARNAAANFQVDLGQPETGTLTSEQIVLLRDATAGRIPQRITNRLAQAATVAEEGGLRSDSSPEDIRDMQSVLTQMGFYSGPIDGNWGGGVEHAVARFQQHEGAPTIGRLSLDQSERILGRTMAPSAEPAPQVSGAHQGRATEPRVRVLSMTPVASSIDDPVARDTARQPAGETRLQDMPREVRTHVSQVRGRCKAEAGGHIPDNEMQGIQQISLDGSPAIIVDNLELCTEHLSGVNCSNRACDLTIWKFEHSGDWRQVFSEHLYGRKLLDTDPATKQFLSMRVGLHAGDNRCAPVAGQFYTSGQSCSVTVSYRNGQWVYVRDPSQ